MIKRLKIFFSRHYLAAAAAILVGLIYFAPHFWFSATNGDVNRGLPLMQVDNEDFYLARMQEILDGHPLLGSPVFLEYKDQPPLSPPTGEFLYTLPTLLFRAPLLWTMRGSIFLLPLILFLLIYFLIYRLLGAEDKTGNKIAAVAGALFVILGYELINYQYVWKLLQGTAEPTRWLIWTRPVNPIIGALFLFGFLHCLLSVVERSQRRRFAVIGGGLLFGLMIMSYFFSWGLALSVMAVAGLFFLLKRDWPPVKNILWIVLIGLLASLPYWYFSWQAKQSPWYPASLLRSGMFYSHYPLFNKVVMATAALFVLFLAVRHFRHWKLAVLSPADLFILSLLGGGLLATNQQIITGMTIWPFHFVQYTIPFSIIAVMVALHKWPLGRLWPVRWLLIGTIFIAAPTFGIYTQTRTYQNALADNRAMQAYVSLFDWLNLQEKECVALVAGDARQFKILTGLIPAFTDCNLYSSNWSYSLMPESRVADGYLSALRIRGMDSAALEEYLKSDLWEARSFLFSNWAGLYDDVKAFPDFKDAVLPERLARLPDDYRNYLDKNFQAELNKYRLDYILSFGALSPTVAAQLPNAVFQQEINGIYIYQYFQPNRVK